MNWDQLKKTIKQRGIKKSFNTPVQPEKRDPLELALFGKDKNAARDTVALGVLTFGDLLYDAACIDPYVIQATDFSRSEEIDNIFKFSGFSQKLDDMGEGAAVGAFANLQGYVAEQYVSAKLVEQGYQVSFPDNPNQAGFDLIVDGYPFQVKCLGDMAGISEHFSKYPDIPVITNAELVEQVTNSNADWADQVFFLEGFSRDTVSEITETSLEAGQEIVDYEIPFFVTAISIARNGRDWWNQEIKMGDVFANVGSDVLFKVPLGYGGALIGEGLGILLFGAAGGVVMGGVLAVAAASQSGRLISFIKEYRVADKLKESLIEASRQLLLCVHQGLEDKISILEEKMRLVEGDPDLKQYIQERFYDDILFFNERLSEVKSILREPVDKPINYALRAVDLARRARVHPYVLQKAYKNLLALFDRVNQQNKSWFQWE